MGLPKFNKCARVLHANAHVSRVWVVRLGERSEIVDWCREKRVIAIGVAFHPELTEDTRVHEYFINLVEKRKSGV
jgi:glutamine amidotransferase PdxT